MADPVNPNREQNASGKDGWAVRDPSGQPKSDLQPGNLRAWGRALRFAQYPPRQGPPEGFRVQGVPPEGIPGVIPPQGTPGVPVQGLPGSPGLPTQGIPPSPPGSPGLPGSSGQNPIPPNGLK